MMDAEEESQLGQDELLILGAVRIVRDFALHPKIGADWTPQETVARMVSCIQTVAGIYGISLSGDEEREVFILDCLLAGLHTLYDGHYTEGELKEALLEGLEGHVRRTE